jgi:hypothetical protein
MPFPAATFFSISAGEYPATVGLRKTIGAAESPAAPNRKFLLVDFMRPFKSQPQFMSRYSRNLPKIDLFWFDRYAERDFSTVRSELKFQ